MLTQLLTMTKTHKFPSLGVKVDPVLADEALVDPVQDGHPRLTDDQVLREDHHKDQNLANFTIHLLQNKIVFLKKKNCEGER